VVVRDILSPLCQSLGLPVRVVEAFPVLELLDGFSTSHAEKLKSLMTLKYQRFEDVSLVATQGITMPEIREKLGP